MNHPDTSTEIERASYLLFEAQTLLARLADANDYEEFRTMLSRATQTTVEAAGRLTTVYRDTSMRRRSGTVRVLRRTRYS
jgi:hypothetical protein